MEFGVYREQFLLEESMYNWVPDGRDLTGYPEDHRTEGIRIEMENGSNKEDGREIRNSILLREGSVWKNPARGLPYEVEVDIRFLGLGLFEDILK